MKNSLFLSMLVFLFIHSSALGQVIEGKVFDAKYDKPLHEANVVIDENGKGDFTDESGIFAIGAIKPGTYTLRASLVGYQLYEQKITIPLSGLNGLSIYLQPTNIALNNAFAVTARRIESSDFASPEAITLIDQAQLKQEIPRSTPEALEGATGIFMQKTNHGGGSPFIRGLTGNQNLLMIDGIRLNNATYRYGPNQYLATIDPYLISNIEVVRGAGSVLYGSDALGGVVNVLSKTPAYATESFMVGGRLGGKWMSEDMQQSGRTEIRLADKKIAFSGGFTYSDFGDIVGGDSTGKQSPTGYKEYAGDMKLRVKLADQHEVILAWQYDKQSDVPRYDKIINNYSRYHFDPQIRQLGYVRLKSNFPKPLVNQLTLTASVNRSDETRILQKTGSSIIREEQDLVTTYGLSAEISSIISENWQAVSGLDYYFDRVGSKASENTAGTIVKKRGYYPDGASSNSLAIYTSHTISLQRWTVIAGGRLNSFVIQAEDENFENVDVRPTALVGSASLMYHLKPDQNLIFSMYSAFRAPNINDLSSFGSFNAGIEIPNPNLKPEKSINMELGYKLRSEKISGSFFVFGSHMKDLINRKPTTYLGLDSLDGERVYTKDNIDKALLYGAEAELHYALAQGFDLYGNLTYTYGQNESDDEPMQRIPPLNGKLGLLYKTQSGLWAKIEWLSAAMQDRLSSGDISDSRIPAGGTPGWNVVNVRAGFDWKWLGISAGFNNLLDEDYRTHGSGINGYGRSVWVALVVEF